MTKETKSKSLLTLSRISALIGGMSLFASVFELLNVGKLLEMLVCFSAKFAFGIEIVGVVIATLLFELFVNWFTKKKEEKK